MLLTKYLDEDGLTVDQLLDQHTAQVEAAPADFLADLIERGLGNTKLSKFIKKHPQLAGGLDAYTARIKAKEAADSRSRGSGSMDRFVPAEEPALTGLF